MNFELYLNTFEKSAKKLDKTALNSKQLEVSTGIVLDSVFLKLYKQEWTNDSNDPLNAEARIFFSVWINDKTIKENKLFYNIHAFKLRKLKGYNISSREFADSFRNEFKKHQDNWENASVKFGPLTLMEGWVTFDEENLENDITKLANNFIAIESLIDNTLRSFKK
ncbi:MAG: hypothetical protein ABI426_00780 [Flavobacterium sp.]